LTQCVNDGSLGNMAGSEWTAASIPGLTGRTVVVTGTNGGLRSGYHRELAHRGAHVVPAVREEAKVRAVAEISAQMSGAQPGARLVVRRLDLAELGSVTAFAAGYMTAGSR
jgi:NAD(P)-dependent dehydrogenase (short-subunit alcohol dehydrogenase family)